MPEQLQAVVAHGGHQHRLELGMRLRVDRLQAAPGSEVSLDRVLMLCDGDEVRIGSPYLKGVKVRAEVVGNLRGPKVRIIKSRRRQNSRQRMGFRADLTELRVVEIEVDGKKRTEAAESSGAKRKEAVIEKAAKKAAEKAAKKAAKKAKGAPTAKKPAAGEKTPAKAKSAAEKPAEKKAAAPKASAAEKSGKTEAAGAASLEKSPAEKSAEKQAAAPKAEGEKAATGGATAEKPAAEKGEG